MKNRKPYEISDALIAKVKKELKSDGLIIISQHNDLGCAVAVSAVGTPTVMKLVDGLQKTQEHIMADLLKKAVGSLFDEKRSS